MLENEEKKEVAEEKAAPAEKAPKKKKTGLLLGILIPVAIIVVAAVVALVLFMSAGSSAVSAYQSGDYEEAYENLDLALFLDQASKDEITKKYITDVLVANKKYYQAVKFLDASALSQKVKDDILASDNNLKLCKENQIVSYGFYEQDNDFTTKDELKWIVLDVVEENGRAKALVMTQDIVGFTAGYNKRDPKNNTYSKSELNAWCEDEFYIDFTIDYMEAKAVVLKSKVVTGAEDETEAHVFILSKEETQKYLTGDLAQYLAAKGSTSAKAKGMTVYTSGNAGYFLRDADAASGKVAGVDRDGKLGSFNKSDSVGVRPCMWIDLGAI